MAQQFLGIIPTARLEDAISDALAADRLYRNGVRLYANGSLVPPNAPLAGTLVVRPPGPSKDTLVLLAKCYQRTRDEDFESEKLLENAGREAYALSVTTWEDREANIDLAKLSQEADMSFT